MLNTNLLKEDTIINLRKEAAYLLLSANPKVVQAVIFQLKSQNVECLIEHIVDRKFQVKRAECIEAITNCINSLAGVVSVDVILDFLNKCHKDELELFDIENIILNTKSNVVYRIPYMDTEYAPIISKLLDINISAGNAAIGRGEVGLAFMCKNAFKGQSDITALVNNQHVPVEIKASKKTDFFLKVPNPKGTHIKALNLLIDKINSLGAGFKNSNRSKDNGIAQFHNTTASMLNKYFRLLGQYETQSLLFEVLKTNYDYIPGFVDRYRNAIDQCVNQYGDLDYDQFKLVTTDLNFEYYMEMSGHEGVLMLNLDKSTFTYQRTGKEFAYLVERNIFTCSSAIDFRTSSGGGLAYAMMR